MNTGQHLNRFCAISSFFRLLVVINDWYSEQGGIAKLRTFSIQLFD